MRQVNFLVIFIICLALVLFGIENTEPTVIHIVKGVDIEAPLCIELIVVMGVGAILAWVFNVWVQLQGYLETGQEIQQSQLRIEELEKDVKRYQVELAEQQLMLPASKAEAQESESSEAFAK